jgi:protein TonB
MFEQSVVPQRTKQGFTSLLGICLQFVGVSGMVLYPLIYVDTLPAANLRKMFLAPPPPPPPPPPPAENRPKPPKVVKKYVPCSLCVPKQIPRSIPDIKDEIPPPTEEGKTVVGSVPGPVSGNGPLGNFTGDIPTAAPPEVRQPEAPKVPAPPQRVRVGGVVKPPKLTHQVVPQYPQTAKIARVQGTVKFTAVIARDGSIQQLQLVSGSPLLVQAAMDAVKQWRYNPTLLNNEPVEVIAEISVNFSLSQ